MQWPPRPGPGWKLHEPERLRRGRVDDLPDVDPHPVAELRELVDERDVDRAEDVLEQLRQLGGLGRRDAVHGVDRARVERGRRLGAGGRDAADDLRHVLRRPVVRPGSTRSGENARWKSAPAFRPLSPRASAADLARRARDTSSTRARRAARGAGARRSRARARRDDREVRLALLRERRRQRDQDRVAPRGARRSRSSRAGRRSTSGASVSEGTSSM